MDKPPYVLDIYGYGLDEFVIQTIPLGDGRMQVHIGRPGRLGLKRDEHGNLVPKRPGHIPGGSYGSHIRLVPLAGGWATASDHYQFGVGVCPGCGGEAVVIEGETDLCAKCAKARK